MQGRRAARRSSPKGGCRASDQEQEPGRHRLSTSGRGQGQKVLTIGTRWFEKALVFEDLSTRMHSIWDRDTQLVCIVLLSLLVPGAACPVRALPLCPTEHYQHPQPQVGDGGPHLRPPVHPPHVPQQLLYGHAQVRAGLAAWTEGMPLAGRRPCQVWEKVCQHVEEVAEVVS